jgi:two-component system capsular synthesis sensor histidine kinase RcsC
MPPASLRVLFVDDDRNNMRVVVSRVLDALGHWADVAAGAEEGLALFSPGRFDVVITDWNMQGLNGADFVRALRSIAPAQPVIVLTGSAFLLAGEAKPEAVDLVVPKPTTTARLAAALELVTRERRCSAS